jgi:uncharacterized protein YutE (UPF0331/DUF86 family)
VNALKEIQKLAFEDFTREHVLQDAAERNFQVAIQASLDIASLILADQSMDMPTEYSSLFPKLAEIGVIPANFAQRLVGMAKFRNVLVHLYLEVDSQRIYSYIQHNLVDFELFAQYVGEYLALPPK